MASVTKQHLLFRLRLRTAPKIEGDQEDDGVIPGIIREVVFTPSDTWVVGDSITSDINPANRVGARCILYLYTHDSYHWEQEYGVPAEGPFYLARTLSDVRHILEAPERFTPVTVISS